MPHHQFRMTSEQAERFWRDILIGSKDECWNYIGDRIDRNGRPRFSINGKTVMSHRIAFFLEFENIPSCGIKRTCGNELCCNPWHMELKHA